MWLQMQWVHQKLTHFIKKDKTQKNAKRKIFEWMKLCCCSYCRWHYIHHTILVPRLFSTYLSLDLSQAFVHLTMSFPTTPSFQSLRSFVIHLRSQKLVKRNSDCRYFENNQNFCIGIRLGWWSYLIFVQSWSLFTRQSAVISGVQTKYAIHSSIQILILSIVFWFLILSIFTFTYALPNTTIITKWKQGVICIDLSWEYNSHSTHMTI